MKTWKQRLIAALCCVVLLVTSLYITEPQKAEAADATSTMSLNIASVNNVLGWNPNGYLNIPYTGVASDYAGSGTNFLNNAFIESYITFGGGMTAADLLEGVSTFYVANNSILQLNWGNRTTAFTAGWSFTIAKGALLPYRATSGTSYMALDKEYTFTFAAGSGNYTNLVKLSAVNTTTFSMPTGQVHGTGKSAASATQLNITGTDITSSSIQKKYTYLQAADQYAKYVDYIDFNGTDFSTVADKSVKIRSIFDGATKCIQVEAWGDLRNDFKVGYQVVFHKGMPLYYTDFNGNAWKALLDGTYVYEGMYSDASHDIVFSGAKIDENASISMNAGTQSQTTNYVNILFTATESVVIPASYIGEDFLADYITGQYIDLSGCSVDLRANGVTFKYIPTAGAIQLAFGDTAKALLKAGDTIVFKAGMPIVYNTKKNQAAACAVLDDTYTLKVVSNDGTTLVTSCEVTGSYSLSGNISNRASESSSYYYNIYLGDNTVWSDSNTKFQGTFTNNSELLENYFISSTATAEEMKAEGWMLRRYNLDELKGLRFYCPQTCWDFETGDYVIFKKGLPVSYTTTSGKTKTTYLDKDYGFVYDAETQKFTYDATLGNEVKQYVSLTISQLGSDSGYDATSNAWKFYAVPKEPAKVPGEEGATTFGAKYEIDGVEHSGTFTRSDDANGLYLTIPVAHLAADADDVLVTIKAGKYDSNETVEGIDIQEDFIVYVYKGSPIAYAGDVVRETHDSVYVVNEADTVKIDGTSYSKGAEYAEIGDHVLTYVVDGCTYAKRLIIYCVGDVKDDGILNVIDLVVMKKNIANVSKLTMARKLSMDMNMDNEITTDDVAELREYLIFTNIDQSPAKEQVDVTSLSAKEKLYYGEDSNLYDIALIDEGNNARIARLMKRAKVGGDYTIAVLGGSISMGTGSTDQAHCYGSIVCDWWIKNFPNANFKFVNAGIGSTNAEMACYRIEEDLLQYEPDFVVVDFTVNTPLNPDVQGTHSTLLYRILSQSNAPAVINTDHTACIYSKYVNGEYVKTPDVPNSAIAAAASAYDVPAVSFHNYVWKKIEEGAFTWNDIGADYIHPNNNGHQLSASVVISYLENVKAQLSDISTEITKPTPLSNEKYMNLTYVNHHVEGITMSGGFSATDDSNAANRGWRYSTTNKNSELTVPLPANTNVKILMMNEGGVGTVTVTGANGTTTVIEPSVASQPTLVEVGCMGSSITIKPSMTSGGFKIYGICIDK